MSSKPGGSTTVVKKAENRVLIVDDQETIRTLIERVLVRDGHACLHAGDGGVALEVLKKESVDLVITDLKMPGISGEELLAEVRLQYPRLPVIIITGQPVVDSAVECIKGGAVDYISKPFQPERLRDVVAAAIAESRRQNTEDGWVTLLTPNESQQVGAYRLAKVVGEGTMGVVYLAYAIGDADETPYAVKILKTFPENDNDGQAMLERFKLATRAAMNLVHENIVRIYEAGIYGTHDTPYLVMEYLDGLTLREYIDQEGSQDLTAKVKLLRQAAAGLAAIHETGIVHRDIKPDNIIVIDGTRVKLTDFSIARVPGSTITMTKTIMGSPAYLSPEAFSSPKLDHRSDLFSLGIVAYELLVGMRPFAGDSLANFARTIPYDRPPRPRGLVPDFPVAVEHVLARLLKKDRDQRYQGAGELVEDLDRYLNGGVQTSAWSEAVDTVVGLVRKRDWS